MGHEICGKVSTSWQRVIDGNGALRRAIHGAKVSRNRVRERRRKGCVSRATVTLAKAAKNVSAACMTRRKSVRCKAECTESVAVGSRSPPQRVLSPGSRCGRHGSGTETCNSETCTKFREKSVRPAGTMFEQDQHGTNTSGAAPSSIRSGECKVEQCKVAREQSVRPAGTVLEQGEVAQGSKVAQCSKVGQGNLAETAEAMLAGYMSADRPIRREFISKWGRIAEDNRGPADEQRTKSAPSLCSVENCGKLAVGKILVEDELGPAGGRCLLHGAFAPRCNAKRCGKLRKVKVFVPDEFGPAGGRCKHHGAGVGQVPRGGILATEPAQGTSTPQGKIGRADNPARWCNIADCGKLAQGKAVPQDALGPTGRRCRRHGAPVVRCNVENCINIGQGRMVVADALGSKGYRCRRHGSRARWCSIENCGKLAQARAAKNTLRPSRRLCSEHAALMF